MSECYTPSKHEWGTKASKKFAKDKTPGENRKMKKFKEVREAAKMKGKDPCWKGYKMVGKKKKDGKEVPNCVPEEVQQVKGKALSQTEISGYLRQYGFENRNLSALASKLSKETKKPHVVKGNGIVVSEEVELDEVSDKTLQSYQDKVRKNLRDLQKKRQGADREKYTTKDSDKKREASAKSDKLTGKINRRYKGIQTAAKKQAEKAKMRKANEETQLDEISKDTTKYTQRKESQ